MRLLLNAGNLHHGGGVAVATSVIHELSLTRRRAPSITVLASSAVDANLRALDTDIAVFDEYLVHDQVGISALWRSVPVKARAFDAVLNVFGPIYHLSLARRSVMGFAQPWIAYPNNPMAHRLGLVSRSRIRLKSLLQSLFFRAAKILVVEHESVATALGRSWALAGTQTEVVPNAVDAVFTDPSRWDHVTLPTAPHDDANGALKLGVVSHNYPHKNLQIFGEVHRILHEVHGIRSKFYVTFPEEEWRAMPEAFREATATVGPLTLAQSASLTAQLDAVVFPTLLECFSATPLEAEALGVPIFASDIPCVRDSAGDYPNFVDPIDARAIAQAIATWHAEGLRPKRSAPPRPAAAGRSAALLALAVPTSGTLDLRESSDQGTRTS